MPHITQDYGSLKKKLVVIWEEINFKVSHLGFVCRNLKSLYILSNFSFRNDVYQNAKTQNCLNQKLKEVDMFRIRNVHNLTNMQMMLVLTIFEYFFLALKAWNCINLCRAKSCFVLFFEKFRLQHEPLLCFNAFAFEMFVE